MKVLGAAFVLSATFSTALRAQAPTGASPVAAWSGCYSLRFGRGSDAVLFADRHTFVRLDTTAVRDGYLVRPGPGRSDRKWQLMLGDTVSWHPIGADSLRIVAPYGYWADVVDLRKVGDSLMGIYRVRTDVIDSVQLHQRGEPVFGKRAACRRTRRASSR